MILLLKKNNISNNTFIVGNKYISLNNLKETIYSIYTMHMQLYKLIIKLSNSLLEVRIIFFLIASVTEYKKFNPDNKMKLFFRTTAYETDLSFSK